MFSGSKTDLLDLPRCFVLGFNFPDAVMTFLRLSVGKRPS